MNTKFNNKDNNNKLAHKVFNYLKEHDYVGRENGITRLVLAQLLDINERELRKAMKEINESPDFSRLVSTSYSVYICETESECAEATNATFKQAVALIKKGRAMAKKVQANGQVKIALSDEEYNEIVETFVRG